MRLVTGSKGLVAATVFLAITLVLPACERERAISSAELRKLTDSADRVSVRSIMGAPLRITEVTSAVWGNGEVWHYSWKAVDDRGRCLLQITLDDRRHEVSRLDLFKDEGRSNLVFSWPSGQQLSPAETGCVR